MPHALTITIAPAPPSPPMPASAVTPEAVVLVGPVMVENSSPASAPDGEIAWLSTFGTAVNPALA